MGAGIGPGPRLSEQHPRKDEPVRHRILRAPLRPREAPAAETAAIETDRRRKHERDGLLGRREGGERIGDRRHAGEDRAAGQDEGLVGLEDHREVQDGGLVGPDEGAGALLGGDAAGTAVGVARLLRPHQPVGGRQGQARLRRLVAQHDHICLASLNFPATGGLDRSFEPF